MQNFPEFRSSGIHGLMFGGVVLAALTSCSRDQTPQAMTAPQAAAAQPSPAPVQAVQVQPVIVMQDDYVYYPEYEVYYSSSRRQYAYRDGSAWVWRPAPPRVSINVLFASPSVHMDFHDSPALHHENVVRSYPRNWSPPAKGSDDRNGRKEDRRDDRKDRH